MEPLITTTEPALFLKSDVMTPSIHKKIDLNVLVSPISLGQKRKRGKTTYVSNVSALAQHKEKLKTRPSI